MNEVYSKTKTYLINEIAEDARGVLSAIADKDPVAVDDMEVLEYCHALGNAMVTFETVAMVAALVPSFLGSGGVHADEASD